MPRPPSHPYPWMPRSDGLALTIRLSPKSAKDAVEGIEHLADGRSVLKARVRALPEAGAANAALIRLIAKALGLPASAVSLESGATSRVKTLFLKGDAGVLESRLATLLGVSSQA